MSWLQTHFVFIFSDFTSHFPSFNCDQVVSVIFGFSEDICTVFYCSALLFWTYLFVFCEWHCFEFHCFHLHALLQFHVLHWLSNLRWQCLHCLLLSWIPCIATLYVVLQCNANLQQSGVALHYSTVASVCIAFSSFELLALHRIVLGALQCNGGGWVELAGTKDRGIRSPTHKGSLHSWHPCIITIITAITIIIILPYKHLTDHIR